MMLAGQIGTGKTSLLNNVFWESGIVPDLRLSFDKDDFDNNLVERLHGTIRERNKTQRGLKDEYSAFIRGHQLYYNFIRPHASLFDNTPAEIAGVDLNLGNNKWEKLLMQSIKYQNRGREK